MEGGDSDSFFPHPVKRKPVVTTRSNEASLIWTTGLSVDSSWRQLVDNPGIDLLPYGVLAGALVAASAGVVVVSAGLQPTSAKQAASVSNAISFIFELLMFPYCERPGLLGRLALSRRTLTHCYKVAKPFFYLPTHVNPHRQARIQEG